MIIKYEKYIKENISIFELSDSYYEFINNYFKKNNTDEYFIISERNNRIDVEYTFGFLCLSIYLKEDGIHLFFVDNVDTHHYFYDKYKSSLEAIHIYLDNFYTYLLNYMSIEELNLEQIPIVNIDNYIDFIEYLFLNYKKYDIIKKYYNDNIVSYFKQNVYNDYYHSELKTIFNKRLGHYINANNFDLI